jgi:hypothetical protein
MVNGTLGQGGTRLVSLGAEHKEKKIINLGQPVGQYLVSFRLARLFHE